MKRAERERRRRGSILIVPLVAMAVVMALAASLLQKAAQHRRAVQRQEWSLQADWLAESGVSRGVARLAADGGYREETWQVSPDELGGPHAGRVSIAVAEDENNPGRRTITVVADYPDHPRDRARARRVIRLE